jgi:hypothetical protein
MGTRHRLLATRGTSLSLLIGLGIAAGGCATPSSPVADAPSEAAKPTPPASAANDAAKAPDAGRAAGPADEVGSNVVIDSVNDHVARTERILAQRRDAQQMADDIKEQRAARDGGAVPPNPAIGDYDPAEIERLAAEIRRQRDASAAAAQPPTPATVAKAGAQAPALANGGEDVVAPPASWDAAHADAVGTLATPPTRVEIAAGPALSGVDPMLAVNERFAGRVAKDPKSVDAQLELQLLRFLRNQPVPEATDIAPLPAEDRELVSAVTDALSNFRSVVRDESNPMSADKARPFLDMADRIRSRADLSVASMSLCERVLAYGNYDPISPPRFAAGQPNWAVFYCEVDGFMSQLDEKQLWGTKLSLALRLYREDGLELWTPAPETVVDASRRRRRDFFIAKKIQLPLTLTPGRYLLKASVRDLQANRVAESTLQLDIVAK